MLPYFVHFGKRVLHHIMKKFECHVPKWCCHRCAISWASVERTAFGLRVANWAEFSANWSVISVVSPGLS